MTKYIFIYCEELKAAINIYSINHILSFNEDILNSLVFNKSYNDIVKSVWEDIKYLELKEIYNISSIINVNNINCFKSQNFNKWGMINHPDIDKVRKGVIKLLMIQ